MFLRAPPTPPRVETAESEEVERVEEREVETSTGWTRGEVSRRVLKGAVNCPAALTALGVRGNPKAAVELMLSTKKTRDLDSFMIIQ
jgi:hypothetical protein